MTRKEICFCCFKSRIGVVGGPAFMAVAIATLLVVAGNRAWDDVNANIGGDNSALHISLW